MTSSIKSIINGISPSGSFTHEIAYLFFRIYCGFSIACGAFLWYNEPLPFAMYYQQLIFWSFVLIAAVGGSRFSADIWLKNRKLHNKKTSKNLMAVACLFLLSFTAYSQTAREPKRVSFTISNPALSAKDLEVRYFNPATKQTAGYGFHLGPLQSHADNKPVGTRIYLKKGSDWQLAFVLTADDEGRKFKIGKTHEISREQWLQAARDEEGERIAALEDTNATDDLRTFAERKGLPMVTIVIAGKLPFKRQVHVRAQLPGVAEKTNHGFSRKLSSFSRFKASYPVGTKIYLCDGEYWNGDVPETLLFTIDAGQNNYLVRI